MKSQVIQKKQQFNSILKKIYRFLLSGATNTALTYALYLVLIRFLNYNVAYIITFTVGILIAYILNRFIVFREKGRFGITLLFPTMYVLQCLLGLIIVYYWVEILEPVNH